MTQKTGFKTRKGQLLKLLTRQKTSFENTDTDELCKTLKQYEGEKAKSPPKKLLFEIAKRKDAAAPLLNIAQDSENWGIGIWRAALHSLFLLGVIQDEKIIPQLISTVSELEEKEYLGDTTTEELSCILANFEPQSIPALTAELKNEQHHEWVRLAVNEALFVIALLHPECTTAAADALKKTISNDSPPILVSCSIAGLCVLQKKTRFH